MAESDAPRLDHRVPIAPAEVNVPNRDTPASPHQYDRADMALHHALTDAPRIVPEPRPAWPQPTEADLRMQLAGAIDRQREFDAALARTTAAHERGLHHVERCQTALAEYAGIDDALTVLRCDPDSADPSLPDDLAFRLGERERCRVELQTAEHACAVLTREMAGASAAAGDAARAVDHAIARVLGCKADDLAMRYALLKAQAWNVATALCAFDRVATAHKIGISPRVARAIGDVAGQLMRPQNVAPWTMAMDALRADPMAEVTITLPAPEIAPLPPPQWSSGPPVPAPSKLPPRPQPPPEPVLDDGDQVEKEEKPQQ
jgi:hypothetical protein